MPIKFDSSIQCETTCANTPHLFVAYRLHILLGPVDPSFRALAGRLKSTVRRHKFIIFIPRRPPLRGLRRPPAERAGWLKPISPITELTRPKLIEPVIINLIRQPSAGRLVVRRKHLSGHPCSDRRAARGAGRGAGSRAARAGSAEGREGRSLAGGRTVRKQGCRGAGGAGSLFPCRSRHPRAGQRDGL